MAAAIKKGKSEKLVTFFVNGMVLFQHVRRGEEGLVKEKKELGAEKTCRPSRGYDSIRGKRRGGTNNCEKKKGGRRRGLQA